MLVQILSHFPAGAHPLTLVSDPDGLLAEEGLLAALAERGFTLVAESDPVRLRKRVEELRPFTAAQPLIVTTPGRLEALPYDLWQPAQRVILSLHDFFPNLAYPVVRTLTPAQRWRLAQASAPARLLGQQGTVEHVLRHAFGADLPALNRPAHLVAWLDEYHQGAEPMPPGMADRLLAHLESVPAYAAWPLRALLLDRSAYTVFVREQWAACVGMQTGSGVRDTGPAYMLDFAHEGLLQNVIPRLVRSGTLAPLAVSRPESLPAWARPGTVANDEDTVARRAGELLASLGEQTASDLASARWEQWQTIARVWAELSTLRYTAEARLSPDQQAACRALEALLDKAFPDWLRGHYALLGAQRLPVPRHVYHVPHYLDFRRGQSGEGAGGGPGGDAQALALLILDGMSLADWLLIGSAWRGRHPAWRFAETLLLAQIPTITVVSRQALVSGLRPAEFEATLDNYAAEGGRWAAFWAGRELQAGAYRYEHLALKRSDPPASIGDHRLRALCLVDDSVDEMAHSSTLGTAGFLASLRLWLAPSDSLRKLEQIIEELLGRGFAVHVTSDHGHVEARGVGRPSEGLMVQTRGQRARVYADRRAALSVQQGFSDTHLWERDGLLPPGIVALMPRGRSAFALVGETVVTHGGIALDEVVVPLVTITQGQG